MCTVSMIGDEFSGRWREPYQTWQVSFPEVSRAEFEELKKEVLIMKSLLERAVRYDKDNNEPHCEMEEKVDLLKKVAKLVGVDLSDVLK